MTGDSALLATLAEDLTDLAETVAAAHRDLVEVRRRGARSLRDELGDLVGDGVRVVIDLTDGSSRQGTISGVGLDHVRLGGGEAAAGVWIALFHVVAVARADGVNGQGRR